MSQVQRRASDTTEALAAAGVTLPDPQPEIQQQRVALVFEQAPAALGTAFIVALVLTVSLRGVADQSLLLSWFGAQLLLTVVRFLHVYRYRKTCQDARKDPRWEKFFFIGTLLSGITWGCLGLIYSPGWAVEYQVLVVICIIGLQAGALSSYAAISGIYIAFMVPSILIFAQSLMSYPGRSHSVMGLLLLVGGGVLLTISRNIGNSILMSLQSRYEHQDLVRKMLIANNSLEIEVATRQDAENALLRERQLFTEGPVIVYRCRTESGWPVEYMSETISGFGYDAANVMKQQMPFEDLIYPEDLQRVKESELLAGRNETLSLGLDYRLVCADGAVRWVYDYVVPVLNGSGEITHYAGYMFDITDRKDTEFELQKERDRVQVTLHSIADAVITTDRNGQIEYLNPMAEELTGWDDKIAHGLSIARIFCLFDEESRDSLEDPVSHCLSNADVFKSDKDAILRRHDGESLSIQYSVSPINNEEDVPQGVIIVFNDVTGTRNMERTITYQAAHDSLTGLINRREFEIQLEDALQVIGSGNTQHALCCLNIDQFKIVNDTCGHDAGDKLLVDVTGVLRGYLRETDILSRIGGDEFGILMRSCSVKDAAALAEIMLVAVKGMNFSSCEHSFDVSASVGLVPIDGESENITRVMSAADLACYAAKDLGGNRLHIYRNDDQDLARRHAEMQWVSKLTTAIAADQLVLYCQEISPVGQGSDEGCHFEVLVRMLDADGGIIPPNNFLPAAERYNMITSLDRWVISHCFSWYAENSESIAANCLDTMSINLSGASVTDEGFMQFIKDEMKNYGVDPEKICFEITETAAIENLDAAVSFINSLKKIGCKFSLDDFGSGLSSFAYLKNLPVDYLKIDGNFVKHMDTDAVDCAMVSSMHQLGSLIGMKTIAEFVENDAILKKLEEIGVDYAQGYGISKPVPLDSTVIEVSKTA